MPYVFWKKWPSVKKTDKSRPRSSNSSKDPTDLDYRKTQILEAQSGYKLHEYVTLDEYYYVSLQDAALRNRDQVLWRSTHPSREPKLSHGRGVDGNTDVPRESDGHCKILVVNQLWLWILDESMTFRVNIRYNFIFWLIFRTSRDHYHEHHASTRWI